MSLQIRPKIAEIEFVRAPWHLRLRWWFAAQLWHWRHSFGPGQADAPDLANPLWRR